MKFYLIFSIICYLTINLRAQNLTLSERFDISFVSTEILEKYKTESDSVLGYENDSIAVDIEIVPFEKESYKFLNNISYGAREIAKDMGLEIFSDGNQLPNIRESFYVVAYDIDDEEETPIFVIAILNKDRQIAYEITVDCYDFKEGEKIVNSFKLLK